MEMTSVGHVENFHNASPDFIKDASPASKTSSYRVNLEVMHWEPEEHGSVSDKPGDACVQLGAIANMPGRPTPINRLPPEVLSYIFGIIVAYGDISCDHWRRLDELSYKDEAWKTYATTLSSVQTTWRQLMVGTASFWSHIDIFVDWNGWHSTPNSYSAMCLQRAKDVPLDFHICCRPALLDDVQSSPEVASLPQYLRDCAVASLNFSLGEIQQFQPFLLAWQGSLSARGLNSLKIGVQTTSTVDTGPDTILTRFLRQSLGSNVARLRTLNLKGVSADWNQIRFPGLVELAIESGRWDACAGPSLEQLRGILIASPELRTLRIDHQRIKANGFNNPELNTPIKMQRLEFLGLSSIDTPEMALLLNIVQPATGLLLLNVGFPGLGARPDEARDNLYKSLAVFCTRNRVRALALHLSWKRGRNFLPALRSCLIPQPNLQALTLSGAQFVLENRVDDLGDILASQVTLRQLHLIRCIMTVQGLKHIVSKCAIHWMKVDSCTLFEVASLDTHGDVTWHWRTLHPFPQTLVEWLKDRIPNLYIGNPGGDTLVSSGCSEFPWWQTGVMCA